MRSRKLEEEEEEEEELLSTARSLALTQRSNPFSIHSFNANALPEGVTKKDRENSRGLIVLFVSRVAELRFPRKNAVYCQSTFRI